MAGRFVDDPHMSNINKHSHRLRAGRFSAPNHMYMITAVTDQRRPLFSSFVAARTLINEFANAQQDSLADTHAFVVMPDHFHWLCQLKDRQSLSRVVQRVKSRTTRRLRQLDQGMPDRIWQKGFHDHGLRKDKDIRQLARYIIANPLRAGLVSSVREYPHWDCIWL